MCSDTPVAVIENTSTLLITEYYSMEYKDQIYVGMPATVSIPQQMMNLSGSVREVSSLTRTSGTGILCFAVTVELSNPGSLSVGLEATCWLDGEIYPSVEDDNGLDASSRQIAYADVTGTAAEICIRNGETVTAGTTLLRLSSDDLPDELLSAADALRDAELSLQTQIDALENYTVTAPIDGTIVDKYYKEGEKSEAGKPLCIIYDLSSLTLTLAVDELDIRLISVGQKATITADAVEGGTYSGVITRVGVNGTNTGGVTTYPVDIRIDETDRLLPSMNADVTIVVGK
ncbi:MAG: HlyD family efflux transporter periplasmic adaptor subunit, partial [Eubacteriales bacterium]|nr:HlyD family efflux transporter periplasmic adaptor subunit [Eubacteriales bacterium]